MLKDLLIATMANQPQRAALVSDHYNYVFYIPYYAGVIIAAWRPLPKKFMFMIFNIVTIIGIIVLATTYETATGFGVGTGFIHFAGGFYEAITPVFCIFI